jgi:membrane-bound ClpP family serine protease
MIGPDEEVRVVAEDGAMLAVKRNDEAEDESQS